MSVENQNTQAEHFVVEWHDDAAIFRLTRPTKLNTITNNMLVGLVACLAEMAARNLRALVIIGEGEKAFCAGTDLTEAALATPEERTAKINFARETFYRLSQAPIISVAAINGLAYGGGLELAMACSFRLAAPHATFSLPEIKLGAIPAYGGTQSLPALIGSDRALDLMLTGRTVDVSEAHAIGLISRVAVVETPLLDQALALANSVAKYSQVAISGIRRCVAAAGPVVTEQGLRVEQTEFDTVSKSEDAAEGVLAFLTKRAPVFKHR